MYSNSDGKDKKLFVFSYSPIILMLTGQTLCQKRQTLWCNHLQPVRRSVKSVRRFGAITSNRSDALLKASDALVQSPPTGQTLC
jgi:hypothetical protein